MILLKEFFKKPTKIGAIAPSSADLAKMIIEKSDLKNKKNIVELGPGTGVFTKYILKYKNQNSYFFALELNQVFVKILKEKFPSLTIYQGSAEHLEKYLKNTPLQQSDCIISGLPWASFNKKIQNKILNSCYENLTTDGIFITFAYLQGSILPGGLAFNKKLKSKFKKVQRSKVVWKNLPPAFVYICYK